MANNPNAGNNTFTGGTTLNQGQLTVQNPLALGTGAINLISSTLALNSNGSGPNGTIILGAGAGSTVNVYGPTTINVDRVAANTGNVWQIGALNLSNNTLNISGGNNYRLRVAGATTILGGYANISNASDVSALILDGVISGSGMLNKTGATVNQRVLTINGTANTYSGGTNIVGGMVQVTGNSGNPLGTGTVKVFHGAELRIAGNGSLGAATLQTMSRITGMGMVSLDNDFNPTVLTSANFSSAYGVVLGLNQPFFTTQLNMASIGDGNAYLGGGLGAANVEYIAPSLGAGAGNTYRLTGGAGTLIFSGADNVLTGANFVQFGNPLANTGTATTFGPGTVTLRNSNNYSLGSSIAKGTTVFLDQGASPGGSTPLGTGSVEIFGTLPREPLAALRVWVPSSNPATGANAQGIGGYVLRPGGLITITDVAGTPPGLQGRWADTDPNGGALDLNGGYLPLHRRGQLPVHGNRRHLQREQECWHQRCAQCLRRFRHPDARRAHPFRRWHARRSRIPPRRSAFLRVPPPSPTSSASSSPVASPSAVPQRLVPAQSTPASSLPGWSMRPTTPS